jgi:KAP family P-loop domain
VATSSSESSEDFTFPSLDQSPYRVGDTARRERWWYSDGIWLDQGPTAANVGFVWTHWLGDRGVGLQGRREGLSAQYARDLQFEAQRVEGKEPNLSSGAQLQSGVRILKERGLIEECYALPTMELVQSALLERGPVIGVVKFRDSMLYPEDIDGWIVCRVAGERPGGGFFACLLNGIALDLTIDGVTGFVRLKTSWGRGWGDGGLALISIVDLNATLSSGSLLPIPAVRALREGVRPDVATDGVPYGPHELRFAQPPIGGDAWTRRDTVGAGAYAEAIARGIQHPETKPPLTIGIKAAWGAGKTSLMRMIRDRSEWPGLDGSSDELRPIHLTSNTAKRVAPSTRLTSVRGAQDLREVTNLTVLQKVRADERTDSTRSVPP